MALERAGATPTDGDVLVTGAAGGVGCGAFALLADRGYDPTMGARPLRRAMQRMLEDPLSERLLFKEFTAGHVIIADVENDDIVFRTIEGFEPPSVEMADKVAE